MTFTESNDPNPLSPIIEERAICTFTRAVSGDIPAIEGMLRRCSAQSRLRRFFRLVPSAPVGYLEQALSRSDVHHLFAIRREEEVIGLAELHVTPARCGDLGLIVEDPFQRRGIGGAALRLLVRRARELDLIFLTADVQLENTPVIKALRSLGEISISRAQDICHIRLALDSMVDLEARTWSCAA